MAKCICFCFTFVYSFQFGIEVLESVHSGNSSKDIDVMCMLKYCDIKWRCSQMAGMSPLKCHGYCSMLSIGLISIFRMRELVPFGCRFNGYWNSSKHIKSTFRVSGQIQDKWKALKLW